MAKSKEEIICPKCGAPMIFKKGDLSDFYHCQKCKKTIVDSMISKYKNK
jgi:DNA-directed RNA polymerase subunit M/transcription elongation factor TFIIS